MPPVANGDRSGTPTFVNVGPIRRVDDHSSNGIAAQDVLPELEGKDLSEQVRANHYV